MAILIKSFNNLINEKPTSHSLWTKQTVWTLIYDNICIFDWAPPISPSLLSPVFFFYNLFSSKVKQTKNIFSYFRFSWKLNQKNILLLFRNYISSSYKVQFLKNNCWPLRPKYHDELRTITQQLIIPLHGCQSSRLTTPYLLHLAPIFPYRYPRTRHKTITLGTLPWTKR